MTQPILIRQETHVMIAGSRYATREMRDYARKVIRRAHAKGIVAGVGNRPRNGECWHGSYVKVVNDTYRGMGGTLLNRYTVRDRWLVDNAHMGASGMVKAPARNMVTITWSSVAKTRT